MKTCFSIKFLKFGTMEPRKNSLFIVIALITIFIFASCEHHTDCTGIITVMKSTDGSMASGTPVPGCIVFVGESDYAKDVYHIDTTDAKGQIKHTWRSEANLTIRAVQGNFTGLGMISLKAGEVVEQTVWLKQNVQ